MDERAMNGPVSGPSCTGDKGRRLLIRDQVPVRALILIGTILCGVSYGIKPAVPLWDIIACGVIPGATRLCAGGRLGLDRGTTLFRRRKSRA